MSYLKKGIVIDVLVTGASGFVGAHFLKSLTSNQCLKIFCPYTGNHGGQVSRIIEFFENQIPDNVCLFEFDLASNSLSSLGFLNDVELVINFASESHVDSSIPEPSRFINNNIAVVLNVLEFCREKPSRRSLVHFSTDEVYGPVLDSESNFEWEKGHFPTNPYAGSKSAQESLAIAYSKSYLIRTAIVNSTNIIGEAQNVEKFIPRAIRAIQGNLPIYIDLDNFGNVGMRKYIAIEDVTSAVLLIIELLLDSGSSESNQGFLQRFHLSGLRQVSNLEVVNIVSRKIKKDANLEFRTSPRPSYDIQYNLSSNVMAGLGWKVSKDPTKKIEEIVDWSLNNPSWLEM